MLSMKPEFSKEEIQAAKDEATKQLDTAKANFKKKYGAALGEENFLRWLQNRPLKNKELSK